MSLSAADLQASARRLQERTRQLTERERARRERERLAAERQAVRQAAREEAERQRRLEAEQAEEQARAGAGTRGMACEAGAGDGTERERREAALERNAGVWWEETLAAVPAPSGVAAAKGIRRAADKASRSGCPACGACSDCAEAGCPLMAQDAPRNGPMYFCLSAPNGRSTHAGLLEFCAAEGFVALPPKVIRCLFGPDAGEDACAGRLRVTYARLPRGERVVLQPREAAFHADLSAAEGDTLRTALEGTLLSHSALSVGDWVDVPAPAAPGGGSGGGGGEAAQQEEEEDGGGGGGAAGISGGQQQQRRGYQLRVVELQPEDQARACLAAFVCLRGWGRVAARVSLIDTDLEAEILHSMETEERIRQEEAAAQARAAAAAAAAAEAAAAQAAAAAEREAAAAAAAARREARRAAAAEALLEEPPINAGAPLVACLFRFPDGGRHARRFAAAAPLAQLFAFVDSQGAAGLDPGSYRLVTQYPRRVFDPAAVPFDPTAVPTAPAEAGSGGGAAVAAPAACPAGAGGVGPTLEEAGLAGPREVLFLEPLPARAEGAAGGAGGGGALPMES
eukprot:scaffold9.g3198.t1